MEKLHSAVRAGERAVPMPFVGTLVIKVVIKINGGRIGRIIRIGAIGNVSMMHLRVVPSSFLADPNR